MLEAHETGSAINVKGEINHDGSALVCGCTSTYCLAAWRCDNVILLADVRVYVLGHLFELCE